MSPRFVHPWGAFESSAVSQSTCGAPHFGTREGFPISENVNESVDVQKVLLHDRLVRVYKEVICYRPSFFGACGSFAGFAADPEHVRVQGNDARITLQIVQPTFALVCNGLDVENSIVPLVHEHQHIVVLEAKTG